MPWPMRFGPPPSTMILRRSRRLRLALLLVGRVQVGGASSRTPPRRCRRACRPAGCRARGGASRTSCSVVFQQVRQAPVGEALALELAAASSRVEVAPACCFSMRELEVDDLLDLREEPAVDLREAVDVLERSCRSRTRRRRTRAARPAGRRARPRSVSGSTRLQVEAVHADLEAAQRLLQRLLEGAADRHHLADATSSASSGGRRPAGTSRTRSAAPSSPRSRSSARRTPACAPPVMSFCSSSSV